jgi:outer membrane protein with beta-barrel domain
MKTTGLLAIVFVMMSIPAFATDLALFGGTQDPGVVTLNSVPDAGQTITQIVKNPLRAGTFGIRFGSGRVVGHEETFSYTNHFIDSNSHAFIMNSNLVVTIPLPVVKPYVTAGIGTFIVSGSGISDIGSKFAYNYGGGVKVFPSGPLGIQGDIRGYTLTGVNGDTMHVVEVSIGVLFHF